MSTTANWLLVSAQHGTTGLSDRVGLPIDIDDLDLPPEVVDRLDLWLGWYDMSRTTPDFAIDSFSLEGRYIAHEIKEALPDWTVVYFDEAAASYNEPDYQYEIETV